jgi:predicted nucleotidyltransferase
VDAPPLNLRQHSRLRREAQRQALWAEARRLASAAAVLGMQRVILFGSLARDEAGAFSDLDLLIVWQTPLGFLERTVEAYRLLRPRLAADLLVYTPEELQHMRETPLIRRVLEEGKVLYEA